jgi:hypothetical protein
MRPHSKRISQRCNTIGIEESIANKMADYEQNDLVLSLRIDKVCASATRTSSIGEGGATNEIKAICSKAYIYQEL